MTGYIGEIINQCIRAAASDKSVQANVDTLWSKHSLPTYV